MTLNIDGLFISNKAENKYLQTLEGVLLSLCQVDLRLKKLKCMFVASSMN